MTRDAERRARYEVRLYDLLQRQTELDEFIIKTKGLYGIPEMTLVRNRVLALLVELGEFANELRTFKHWSNKGPSPKADCLDEYVDALHFLLSITNSLTALSDAVLPPYVQFDCNDISQHIKLEDEEMGYEPDEYQIRLDINSALMGTFVAAAHLAEGIDFSLDYEDKVRRGMDALGPLWSNFTELGAVCGFKDEEIDEAYMTKWRTNFVRQEQGY